MNNGLTGDFKAHERNLLNSKTDATVKELDKVFR